MWCLHTGVRDTANQSCIAVRRTQSPGGQCNLKGTDPVTVLRDGTQGAIIKATW